MSSSPVAQVVNFREAIRARLAEMSHEHMIMLEEFKNLPVSAVAAYCKKMDEHARIMSKLASRLYEDEAVPDVPTVPTVPNDSEPPEAA